VQQSITGQIEQCANAIMVSCNDEATNKPEPATKLPLKARLPTGVASSPIAKMKTRRTTEKKSSAKVEKKKRTEKKAKRIVLVEDSFKTVASKPTKQPSKPTAHLYRHDEKFVAQVNAAQDWFTVKAYPEFEGLTIADLQRKRGGSSTVSLRDTLPPHAKEVKKSTKPKRDIPTSFDWRNISGTNFVSPVRDQGSCGSCYSFGSAGMMEARIRIASNNQQQPIISTQDIVSCSEYAQGCEGGFPYLIAGKYGRDFGLLEEACYPYQGMDSACEPNPQPGCIPNNRWFTNGQFQRHAYLQLLR
jgi:C1A family cysteine protease